MVAGTFTLAGAYIQRGTDVLPPEKPPPLPSSPHSPEPSPSPSTTPTDPSTPAPTRNPSTPTPNGDRVEIGLNNYFDVDARVSSTKRERGYEFEIVGGSARLLPLKDVRVVIVKDSQATSFDGCARGTRLVTYQVAFHLLKDDETICVLSNQGAWATLKLIEDGSDFLAFDMRLMAPA